MTTAGKFQEITIDDAYELLEAMSNESRHDLGTTILHTGEHPSHGAIVLALTASDRAAFLRL